MQINAFKLERYFAEYEFAVRYLLSASDCEALTLKEVLALADPEMRTSWDGLGLGYTESLGHPLLRAEVARLYERVPAEGILIAVPEEAIFIAMNVLLAPGDHVIVTYPAYQSLYELARALGCEVTPWTFAASGSSWQLDLEFLERSITPRTRLLVVNFPHNPTGYLPERAQFEAILDVARQHGLYVFSDEMYRLLEYNAAWRLPPACDLYEKAVSLSGLSKTFALPGLRVGWLATRDRDLYSRCATFKDYTTICGSAPGEILAIVALRAKEAIIARNLGIIRDNLMAANYFFGSYPSLFEWIPPQAGSIAFPGLAPHVPADLFCKDVLAREGVMIVPGSMFEFPGNHFRIGLGRKNFPEALWRVQEYVENHLV